MTATDKHKNLQISLNFIRDDLNKSIQEMQVLCPNDLVADTKQLSHMYQVHPISFKSTQILNEGWEMIEINKIDQCLIWLDKLRKDEIHLTHQPLFENLRKL